MKISYNWLKDYIDVKLPAEKLAEELTMAGLTVDSIEKEGDDHILEIEVTSNRPDWLSYIGVARELAAITGARLKTPKAAIRAPGAGSKVQKKDIVVKVDDKTLCPRYTARVIRNVKVGESPAWLKAKIEAMGLRPVNNIVDITNFCLFETGEPMHAFDLDKIEGKEIVVRKAKTGEKMITIDGTERILDDSILVIADSIRPIAVAGVMGGLNTEVNYSTKNILLEAASFDQVSTRRASRKLGISTDSSYRFERSVDISNIVHSSNRALDLIKALAGGEAGEFLDIGKRPKITKTIGLRFSRLDKILGIHIQPVEAKRILKSLGFGTKFSSGGSIKLNIPDFRQDIKDEIDLIEEVSRIFGYGRIPETIPPLVEQTPKMPRDLEVDSKIRAILTGLGMDEIITYSLLSKKLIAATNHSSGIVRIKNPLSGEQEAMRPNLLAGMLGAAGWNVNRKTKNLKLFEIGNIYKEESDGKFSEKKALSLGLLGEKSSWSEGTRPVGFFDLKGIVEELLTGLGMNNVTFARAKGNSQFSPAAAAHIVVEGETIGAMGEVSRKVAGDFDIKENVYFCEMSIEAAIKFIKFEKRFSEIPKYPSAFRDISIVVGKENLNSDVESAIRNSGGASLKDVKLTDKYAGKQIPDGKIGLTYRLEYRDPSRTLEDKDISDSFNRILQELEQKFGAKLR